MKSYLKRIDTVFLSKKIIFLCLINCTILWILAELRHFLLQSNAFDLGLFDQWIWLASNGLPPYSSMTGLHIFADHGAWFLYIASIFYRILPSIHLLLLSQSFALSFTAIPLLMIAKLQGLNEKQSQFICIFWFLQPLVFNVNLFDFHPEVWAMPILAFVYLFDKQNKTKLWIISLFLILGTRDGLVLLVLGLAIEQILRKNFYKAFLAAFISLGWLTILNNWIYPILNEGGQSIMAISRYSYLGNSIKEILFTLITNPMIVLSKVDWSGGCFYLFILLLPFIFFLRKNSLITISSAFPLLITNILSESFSQRTLIHHYSLPIAVILVVTSIDSISEFKENNISINRFFIWILLCWGLLAKPWFFLGPYFSRLPSLTSSYDSFKLISRDDSVLTTSYLAPHLTQRINISFPRDLSELSNINKYDAILLNPLDPGWGSDQITQKTFLDKARFEGWRCRSWNNGQELCLR
tara:strand:- start:2474 stop:3877 length:1404 start_codon:yes stop_codon:yes gene_type:complete